MSQPEKRAQRFLFHRLNFRIILYYFLRNKNVAGINFFRVIHEWQPEVVQAKMCGHCDTYRIQERTLLQ
jgi:hypothetical protein